MNRRAVYVNSGAPSWVSARRFHVLALLFLALLAIGCANQPVYITRTEIQRIPTPVFIPVAEEFVEPLEVPEFPEDLTNRDLEADISALEALIDKAQDDRSEIRKTHTQEDKPEQRSP